MATKLFECTNCDNHGKITVKSGDIETSDIVFCPVCGADIGGEPEEDECEE